LTREVKQALRAPAQLAKVIEASNRLQLATQQAQVLIDETEKRETPKRSSLADAFIEYQEKRDRERAAAKAAEVKKPPTSN
jgi:hypothetical protein